MIKLTNSAPALGEKDLQLSLDQIDNPLPNQSNTRPPFSNIRYRQNFLTKWNSLWSYEKKLLYKTPIKHNYLTYIVNMLRFCSLGSWDRRDRC